MVTDTLPPALTYSSFTGAGWKVDRTGQTLTFTWIGATPVPVGPMTAITLVVDVDSALISPITNTASVSEPTDPTSGPEEPDSDSVTTPPNAQADLGIDKSHTGNFVAGTNNNQYRFTVTNFGPSDAAGPIKVTDTLPADLSYVPGSATAGWTCTAAGQDLTCTRAGGLVVGDHSTFTIDIAVDAAASGDHYNVATVSGPTPDPNPTNDSDDDNTGIDVESDLSITKTLLTNPVVAGEDVTYRLRVHNGGPSVAPGTIKVGDALPTGLTYVSASGGPSWSCSHAAGVITCEHAGNLGVGDDAPDITVVAHVASGIGQVTPINAASVTGPMIDPDPGNNTDHEPTPVTEEAEISVTKTRTSANPAVAGGTATFEVVVSNAGPSDASDVTATDLLPSGMTIVSASGPGWICAGVVCSRDRIVAGTSAPPITIVARIASGTPGGTTLTNQVTVATVTPGDTPAGNTDDATVDVVAEADLALTKTHTGGTVVAGTPTTYTITVTNNGLSDAVGPIKVVDTLPASMSFLSAGAPWTCTASGSPAVVTCTVTSGLAAGASLPPLEIQVMVDASAPQGSATNTATVSSPTTDPVPGNNTDDATVDITRSADLWIQKSHEGAVHIGDVLEFTILVGNDGPSAAQGVKVTDAVPNGLDVVDAMGSGWSCSVTGQNVACDLSGSLAPGTTAAPITVTVGVTSQAYPGVVNTAKVDGTTDDPDPSDNTDDDPVTVPPLADLAIEKSHQGTLKVGEEGTYLLEVTNNGPTEATGPIVVTDTLPDGLEYVEATGSGWSCSESTGVVTCELPGPLGAGETTTITLVVDVLPAAYPQVQNTANVSGPAEDPDPDNNGDTDEADVEPDIALGIAKEVADIQGRTVHYRITVTNTGLSDTVDPVVVRDPMPDGLRLVRAGGSGWSCVNRPALATCQYAATIPAGAARSLTLVAQVTATAGTAIVNVATVSGGGTGGKVSDNAGIRVNDDGSVDDPGDGDGTGGLPNTGGPALVLVPLALLLLLAGGLLVARSRRRI